MSQFSSKTALIIVSVVSIIWGMEFVLVDLAIEHLPTHSFNAIRFFVAALALLPVYFFSTESKQKPPKRIWLLGAGLGSLLFIGFYTQTQGMYFTSVANAGFITGLSVPLVSVLGFLIFKNKTGVATWLGISLATIGLYFLTVGDNLIFNDGDLLVLICAFAFALHIVVTDRYVSGIPVLTLSVIQLFCVAIYSLIAAVYNQEPLFYPDPVETELALHALTQPIIVWAIIITALLGTSFSYWAITSSQKILHADKTALLLATEPVFAYITAWIVLNEQLGLPGLFGGALIVAGMIISEIGDPSASKNKADTPN